jgi:ribosomal protein S18 acetylase RimI-like enzyme
MIVRLASPADAEALARLHADSLAGSLLTSLGAAALARFYAYVMTSPVETVWSAEDGGRVVGGCVLSDEPHSVLRRFARHAPVQLARELATQLVRNGELRGRVLRGLRERGDGDGPHAPEVTQIFTDATMRGRGIGAQLLRTCEASLRTRNVRNYFVHTERDDNEAGIRFYHREGFVTIGESRSFGQAFLILQKDL